MSLLMLVLIALLYGYLFFFNNLHIKYENIISEIESLIIQGDVNLLARHINALKKQNLKTQNFIRITCPCNIFPVNPTFI